MKKLKNQIIKKNRIYSFKEIAKELGVHIRTVQEWRKQGMNVIDENSKPYLVEGHALKEFLKQKSTKRKCTLKEGEFFCLKCRTGRRSLPDKIEFINTGKSLGKEKKEVRIKGICAVCGKQIYIRKTEPQVIELVKKGVYTR